MEPMKPMSPAPGPQPLRTGAWAIIVIIALIIAAAAWYYYAYYPSGGAYQAPNGMGSEVANQPALGTSDGVSAIEQDLNATDLGDLDRGLADIDAELAR